VRFRHEGILMLRYESYLVPQSRPAGEGGLDQTKSLDSNDCQGHERSLARVIRTKWFATSCVLPQTSAHTWS
jgi:hypothetical protein